MMNEMIKTAGKFLARTAAMKLGKRFIMRSSPATIGIVAAAGIGYYAYRALNKK